MIDVNMIAYGQDVKGQGVGSAYQELVQLLENFAGDEIRLHFNSDKGCQINHVHTIHPFCYTQMAASSLPTLMHVHFLPETLEGSISLPGIIQPGFIKYVLSMYKAAQELVVVNPIFIDPLADYGIDRDRITYMPNVVASKDFRPLKKENLRAIGEKYGVKPDRFTVMGVGQVQTRKGVLDFLNIAQALPDVQFLWAGGFSFGAVTDGYKDLKKAVDNPPPNAKFLGIVDRSDMNALYNLSDLLLMTSYNELFPMSILEAVNAGLPILVRDLDLYRKIYFSDYPRANENEEFIDWIGRLRDNPETYQKARAAAQKIQEDYSEESIARLWKNFYRGFFDRWS